MDKGSAPAEGATLIWLAEAERELRKIPFFVRGKARRNTETYAARKGLHEVTLDTLYEAKAHFAR
jgi:light-independent protochlorophyllide reductase subunit B